MWYRVTLVPSAALSSKARKVWRVLQQPERNKRRQRAGRAWGEADSVEINTTGGGG